MEKYKEVWKKLSNEKKNSNYDHYIYALIRALNAKSVKNRDISAEDLALILLSKHYTPVTNETKLANGMHKWLGIIHNAGYIRKNNSYRLEFTHKELMLRQRSDLFHVMEEEEFLAVARLDVVVMKSVWAKNIPEKEYVYIFVRDDLSKEQQVVQSSHVALVLGNQLRDKKVDELHFVLCHAKSEEELVLIKNHFIANQVAMVHFIEPDMNHSLTAIASYPVKKSERNFAKQFSLLTYNSVDTEEYVM